MVSQLRKEYHWAMFDLCIRGSISYYRNGVIICTSSTNLTNHDGLIGSMLKMLLHKKKMINKKRRTKTGPKEEILSNRAPKFLHGIKRKGT